MSLHPEVERRAQAELDTILGAEHLPTPSDIEHLPYLHAILKEVLRYAPVGNLGERS
jgi:cytochrome P450